ncbi:MAG: prenyltransferase/squalene oxidase repeat-containing protein [Gemmataceae bacterium]|nr:hypothetical protein [Gemmata sp.]MDW8197824.1 prenyltransferase/squalene oxidase repeat-containing protein [Gemmataceae bacterium]
MLAFLRYSFLVLLVWPSAAQAQLTPEQKKATIQWITNLQDPQGGFYLAPQDPNIDAIPQPGLRATSGAVRALKYLGADIPNKDKHAAFVLKCYDATTGGFAEPGGAPDVTLTSVGIMAAVELGIPREKIAKAMDYLKDNAKTFEEIRIAAAAVEAWGVKDCPFDLKPWLVDGPKLASHGSFLDPRDGGARQIGSVTALLLRLGSTIRPDDQKRIVQALRDGQRSDGGWGQKDAKASDVETTYRVMRALMLLKSPPADVQKLRAFIDMHRNADGGYTTQPGEKSTMSGVYYCVVVSKWLDEMEKK